MLFLWFCLFACSFLSACAAPAAPAASTATASQASAVPTISNSQTPTPLPTVTVQPTAASTPVPRATPAERPLLIWAVAPEPQQAALATLLNDTARSAGVPLLVVAKSPNALTTDITVGTQLGQLPDLVWGGADDLFLLKEAGLLQPTADRLETRLFLPATVEGATSAGQRWGTPLAARGFLLLLYNRKLVDSAPQNTDELLIQARRLKNGQQAGMVAAWIEMRWLEPWLRGYASSTTTSDGSPQFDTPAMVSVLGLLKQLRTTGAPPPTTYADGVRLFRNGRAAFAIDGDWKLPEYRTYSETLDLGYAPLPIVSATGRPALAPLEGVYLMYSANLDDGQLAAGQRLAGALTQVAAQARIAKELGHLPALREALRSPAVTSDPALAAAATYALTAPGIPPQPGLRCAWAAGEQVLPQLLLGELNPEQAAKRLQDWATACVGT